jgi:hypothetical protein
MAWPKVPDSEGRDLGVRAIKLLLSDRGRAFGVSCRFCTRDRGRIFVVDTGRATEGVLLGVAVGVATLALRLLFASLLGVAGMELKVPSLVVGLLPLLDIAEAGRGGGCMLLSALKKLGLRLTFPPAGDDGS